MNFKSGILLALAAGVLAACEDNGSVSDGGFDAGALQDGIANIWVDPDGCQHWYIDDGVEGFMTPRLQADGSATCRDNRGMIAIKGGGMVMAEPEPMMAAPAPAMAAPVMVEPAAPAAVVVPDVANTEATPIVPIVPIIQITPQN